MTNKQSQLDFSEDKIERLQNSIFSLQLILSNTDSLYYNDYLNEILNSAQQRNSQKFAKLVISNELFGGAGALWEIYFSDTSLDKEFKSQFYQFINCIEDLGIRNPRITQVKEGLLLI